MVPSCSFLLYQSLFFHVSGRSLFSPSINQLLHHKQSIQFKGLPATARGQSAPHSSVLRMLSEIVSNKLNSQAHVFFERPRARRKRETRTKGDRDSAPSNYRHLGHLGPSSYCCCLTLVKNQPLLRSTLSGENQPPQHSARGTYVISHHVSMRGSRVTTTPSATPRPGSTSQYPRNTPKPIRSDVCQSVPSSTLQVSRRPSIELSAPRYMMPDRNQAWCFGAVSLLGFNATSPLSSAPRIRQRHTVQSCPRWIRGDIITSKNVLEFFPSLLILIFSS